MSKAMIITHADPSWGGAKKLDENIRARVSELKPDLLISLDGNPEWDRWDGDMTLPSQRYEIDDAIHLNSLAGNISDYNGKLHETLIPLLSHNEVSILGGYWNKCHLQTFSDVAELWTEQKLGGTLIIPSDCVTDDPEDYKNSEDAIMSRAYKIGDISNGKSMKGNMGFFSGYWNLYDHILLKLRINFERTFEERGPDVIYRIKK